MEYVIICIAALIVLALIAGVANHFDKGSDTIQQGHDCSNCSEADEGNCKLHELVEHCKKATILLLFLSFSILMPTGCSTKKNTPQSRWWHSFNARYNTYFNGSQAFIEGNLEKENGNKDNYTELIPLYPVGNKQSRDLGKGNFNRAIEKSEKAIKQHSIKARPEWNKSRRKTQKDIEWLNRREYNPFLWRAWLLLGKSQFQQGLFEESAATFSYMSRLYQTQPAILGIARAWLAKSYVELDWLYDAEDVIVKQRRDSMDFRAVKDWDYTFADYYIHSQRYEEALPYLRKVISHERRRKQRAREWFLYGQLQSMLGHRQQAYDAYRHVVRLNPPYELEFNARIAQTEVMAAGDAPRMIRRLKRMAASDNNKDYLDQVYYAIGNIHLSQRDTTKAIEAYEEGYKKATRSGIEKGVLLLTLGNLYWAREKFGDAQRCYGEAIGLLDKDRKDYQQLSERSKLLDELVPHTNSVQLQDSLQRLAKMPEAERLKIIDNIIAELKKKEKEEREAREAAEAEQTLAQQSAIGNRQLPTTTQPTARTSDGTWYFYNPQTVSQGKRSFEQQWGKRENVDDWQRNNRTVVSLTQDDTATADSTATAGAGGSPSSSGSDAAEGETSDGEAAEASPAEAAQDSAALDPHNREYYLAQIPFTDEQLTASHDAIKDGLFHAGILLKDKFDNLRLSEKYLKRLTTDYPDYEHNDEAWYHLFLLYSRMDRLRDADRSLDMLKAGFPESQWTILLSDPYFAENQRLGVHIEDSLYAATYDAFKADRYQEVTSNTQLSASRFPLGQHHPKFLFIEGLSLLNTGDAKGCTERMQQVVEEYPQSEVSELAGMILRGVQQGRTLHGGKFDMGDVWSRRTAGLAGNDSVSTDTLRFERNTSYVFLLAYQPDSVNQNQLLYEMARHNFSNYLVRNFDIVTDQDANGLCRMLISGFLSYDEVRQYARQLYAVGGPLKDMLRSCRSLIVSDDNLRLLGTAYSYRDYEVFFEKQLAPVKISTQPLLNEPETIVSEEEEEDYEDTEEGETPQQPNNDQNLPDDLFFDSPVPQQGGYQDFPDDFW